MQDEAQNSTNAAGSGASTAWLAHNDEVSDNSVAKDQITVELTAAVIAIRNEQPVVLTKLQPPGATEAPDALPSAQFRPAFHSTLEEAIRTGVESETGLDLGFLEQLSSDCPHQLKVAHGGRILRKLSIGHLALTRADRGAFAGEAVWASIYAYFPWEDWRSGRPAVLSQDIIPQLTTWVAQDPGHVVLQHPLCRRERVAIAFGLDGGRWDDERVLERLDLLSESGLAAHGVERTMHRGHRRTLAAALGRLRAKIRHRPVVFELLPPEFTLFELQKSVEAILGPHLHKQNFRRLVEGTGLVEPTGEVRTHTGGRPAKLFRFRREVLLERPAPGVRVRPARAS